MSGHKTEPVRRTWIAGALLLLALLLIGCNAPQAVGSAAAAAPASPAAIPAAPAAVATLPSDAHSTSLVAPKLYTYRVVNTYPHDPAAYTQGLIVRDGQFLEGTGRNGQSTLRRVDIETGKVLEQRSLDEQYFGEGITELDGKIYQLTWSSGIGFIYDAQTLEPQGQFAYAGEGWGMTHDGEQLIISNGTSIQFWDPATMQPLRTLAVSLFGLNLGNINELEYFDGALYANIWQTNLIVRIEPTTGQITAVVDLSGLFDLLPAEQRPTDLVNGVLNGIAYDEETGRLFVTGKWWPAVFEIELLEVPS